MEVHQFWTSDADLVPDYVRWSVRSYRQHHPAHVLWTYNPALQGLPPETVVRDANIVFDNKVFDQLVTSCDGKLTAHQKRAVAADFFRLKLLHYLLKCPAPAHTGVVGVAYADTDSICLRSLPIPSVEDGAWFTCNPARRSGGMVARRRETSDVCNSPRAPATSPECFTVMDGRDHFSTSVWGFRYHDARCVDYFEKALSASPDISTYNTAMFRANDVRQALEFRKVYPYAMFHALPWFNLNKAIKAGSAEGFTSYGSVFPAAKDVLDRAYAFELYGSKFSKDAKLAAALHNLPPASMLGVLLKNIKD